MEAETDGIDPDDAHQHGTACMGMAQNWIDSGAQTEFYEALQIRLVDVRIGTDLGAGPFKNYV